MAEQRLIDAEPYKDCMIVANDEDKGICVKDIPTVDAVPVIHGHWIRYDIDYDDECSNCHAHTDRALMCCYGSPSTRYEQHHFCPWCGAKMTGDFIYDLETGEQIRDGEQDG